MKLNTTLVIIIQTDVCPDWRQGKEGPQGDGAASSFCTEPCPSGPWGHGVWPDNAFGNLPGPQQRRWVLQHFRGIMRLHCLCLIDALVQLLIRAHASPVWRSFSDVPPHPLGPTSHCLRNCSGSCLSGWWGFRIPLLWQWALSMGYTLHVGTRAWGNTELTEHHRCLPHPRVICWHKEVLHWAEARPAI